MRVLYAELVRQHKGKESLRFLALMFFYYDF